MNIAGPDLLLRNCRVLTMDPQHPFAGSVGVKGERIVWVGSDHDSDGLVSGATQVIDGEGRTLLPGFHDAHIHLLAYAATLEAVDCGPTSVLSIVDIKRAIARRTETTPYGQWVSAAGYSEFDLIEGRHPTRWDLDRAAPKNPVRLNHRSGHACVLNSRALELVGIANSTLEPPGGTIVRDLTSGTPNGVLLEMDSFLDAKIPAIANGESAARVEHASAVLASMGITAIQDATPSNSVPRWDAFRSLKSDGILYQRVTFMVGAGHMSEFVNSGAEFGSGDTNVRIGAAKVMVTESGGSMRPDPVELREIVRDAHARRFQVAIHAVESSVVSAAAEAIASVHIPVEAQTKPQRRHRIEHCSELPPDVFDQVVASGAVVVTQPGFIYSSGRRYMAEVVSGDQPWLYRIGALIDAGVGLGFGSDAPVIDPNPMLGIYSAVSRKSEDGIPVAKAESIALKDALRGYTIGPAFACHMESEVGVIKPGTLADLILLDRDITSVRPEELTETQVTHTIIGGSPVWNLEDN